MAALSSRRRLRLGEQRGRVRRQERLRGRRLRKLLQPLQGGVARARALERAQGPAALVRGLCPRRRPRAAALALPHAFGCAWRRLGTRSERVGITLRESKRDYMRLVAAPPIFI